MQNTVTSTSRTVPCLGCSIRRHIPLILLILLAPVPKTCQGAKHVQQGGEQKPWLQNDNLETNGRHMPATSSRHLQSTSEQEEFCDWYETTIGQSDAYECDCEGRSGEVEDSEDANNVGIFLRCRKFPTPCTPEAWCPQTVVESLLVVSTVRQGNGTTAANNANNLANITEIQFTQTCTTWSLSEHSYTYCVQVQPSQSTAASPDSETLDATWMVRIQIMRDSFPRWQLIKSVFHSLTFSIVARTLCISICSCLSPLLNNRTTVQCNIRWSTVSVLRNYDYLYERHEFNSNKNRH